MEKEKRLLPENAEEKMFASSSNLGGFEDRTDPRREQDSNIQKQNLDIIKHILEMFNLDDTKRKYETQSVVEYVLDPNELSYDCSLSTTRVRQRLCDLMGTDVIRLNDKRYFQKLSERLQDEYEQTMDKQEDARSAAEEQRIRRLMLEGVIKTADDYRAVVQGSWTKKPNKKKKKRKSKKRNSDGTPSSVDGTSTEMSHHSDEDRQEPDLVTQVSITSGSRPESSVPSRRSNRPGSAVRPQSRTHSQAGTHSQSSSPSRPVHYEQENEHVRPPHHGNVRASSSCSTHRKSKRVKSASSRLVHWEGKPRDNADSDEDVAYDTRSLPAPSNDRPPSKFSRHENELVKTLRQEETVAGLYSLAEELVSPVKTEELVGKMKVIVKPTKKKMKPQF